MATSKQNSSDIMERKAINSSGRLGSLYDGCRDRILQQSNESFSEQCLQPSRPPHCKLMSGDTDESNNLLRWIDIQDDLRLSLLLKLTKRDGIGAVLDYHCCIDNYTRFLYYSWMTREHRLRKPPELKQITGLWRHHTNATHIVTSVTMGIDVVIILQLPPEAALATKIDFILKKIHNILLIDKQNAFTLSSNDNKILEYITNTKVYSNIPNLTCLSRVSNLVHEINLIKCSSNRRRPSSYTLQTVTSLYPASSIPAVIFKPMSADLELKIEQKILQFRSTIKYLEANLDRNAPKVLRKYLIGLLTATGIEFSLVKQIFMEETQRFSKLVVDARSNRVSASEIDQALHNDTQIALSKDTNAVIQNLKDFKTKDLSIPNLHQQDFEYRNQAERNLNRSDDSHNRLFNCSDISSESNQFKLNNQHNRVLENYENNCTPPLADVDFLDSSLQVDDRAISPSNETDHNENYSKQTTSSLTYVSQNSSDLPTSPPLTDDTINILLLGETGVGKSTFINAFANYLTFDSLEHAQSNEPTVLIPVSFIMTTGDNFDEHTVKFGEFDSLNNEDFNSVGQSVTQLCKSYVFDLKENRKKVRIIDTPGFGDTRGIEQDDQNMEHILQYISNLTHLNAICFLLKPNSSRLNIFFRTCLTQLFSFLNPDARKNVIFCFTNARSTFYTPGDTAPLLKTMLTSASIKDIPFNKENTFCFDSESFRYLVALQNGISFSGPDKNEYETSWSTSMKQSNRLIDYINTQLFVYHIENGCQSIKHAQFQISYMIRPILEAIRNILRNIILSEENLSNEFIELRSKALHHAATRCLSCISNPKQVGKFWIINIDPHEIQDGCRLCSCTLNQHVTMNYTIEYECLHNAASRHQNTTNEILEILCDASVEFAFFLMHKGHSTKDDPFLIGLEDMVHEETEVCKSQKSPDFNLYLVKKLIQLQESYNSCKQKISETKSNQESIDLPTIYRLIDKIDKYPMVHEQMVAVKQSQQMTMEDFEYETQTI